MKKIIAVIAVVLLLLGVVFLQTNIFNASKARTEVLTEDSRHRLAINKIQQLILKHPEPLVSEKLLDLIKSGKVLFALNNVLPEMNSSLEHHDGKDQVILWYNFTFLLDVPEIINPADKEDYLLLVLYHEAVHIDDHFSGRYSLMPIVSDKSVSEYNVAKIMWNMEWSAVSKEWAFAKKIKKPYLVPMIYKATKSEENPRTFLNGFYQLQMTGNATAANSDLVVGFRSRYKEELAKLPTH